jgi:hypothetical protein
MVIGDRVIGMKAAIDACLDCYKECMGTAMMHCLMEGGAHVEPKHFRLMMACAEICKTCASLMLMGSPHHTALCEECVTVCNECADSCDALGGPEMQECADNCR